MSLRRGEENVPEKVKEKVIARLTHSKGDTGTAALDLQHRAAA